MKRIKSSIAIQACGLMLTACIMFLFATLSAQGQQPTASCAYCNRSSSDIAKSGHAPGCRYYTPSKTGSNKPTQNNNPTIDPIKPLNEGLDLLDKMNDTIKDNSADDNRKKEELLKKKEEQKTKHTEGMKTFKPIETKMPSKPIKGSVMAVVTKCIGSEIEINRNGQWQKINCASLNNQIITTGDTLRTGKDSKIIIKTKEEGFILMFPNTKYALPNSNDFALEVLNGKIRVLFDKLHKKFEVRTRGGACCAVRGTQVEIIANDDNSAEISLFEGDVEVVNTVTNERILKLTPGKKVKINTDGSINTLENILVNDFLKSFEE